MRPLFVILGLSGTVLMLTGIIGLSLKPSQDWGYRQLMLGLFSTSFAGGAIVLDELTNRSSR